MGHSPAVDCHVCRSRIAVKMSTKPEQPYPPVGEDFPCSGGAVWEVRSLSPDGTTKLVQTPEVLIANEQLT